MEVDSSCTSEFHKVIGKAYLKVGGYLRHGISLEDFKKDGVKIPKRLSDRIEVRNVAGGKPCEYHKAFLLPEKEDKCDGKCVPNECLCEWEDMTKEQVKAEALPSITEKYGKSFEKSYTIEEIEKAIRLLHYEDYHLDIIVTHVINNLKR